MVPNHRAARSFFMVGDCVKISATMVGQQQKILKLHSLKCPKTVPKPSVAQKKNH